MAYTVHAAYKPYTFNQLNFYLYVIISTLKL